MMAQPGSTLDMSRRVSKTYKVHHTFLQKMGWAAVEAYDYCL